MQEHSFAEYLPRTEANAVDSDAALIMTHGKPTGGSRKTIDFAVKLKRPWFHIRLDQPMGAEVKVFVEWLKEFVPDGCTLNVAGTWENKRSGIQKAALVWVLEILGRANGKCYYPPVMERSDHL